MSAELVSITNNLRGRVADLETDEFQGQAHDASSIYRFNGDTKAIEYSTDGGTTWLAMNTSSLNIDGGDATGSGQISTAIDGGASA